MKRAEKKISNGMGKKKMKEKTEREKGKQETIDMEGDIQFS